MRLRIHMNNKILILLIILLAKDGYGQVWDYSEMPKTLIIDSSKVPQGSISQSPNATQYMINEVEKWNSNPSLGPLVNIIQQKKVQAKSTGKSTGVKSTVQGSSSLFNIQS